MTDKSESSESIDLKDSVFLKQSEIPKSKCKLCYQTIIDTLPEPIYKKSLSDKRKKFIEWRWRFFDFSGGGKDSKNSNKVAEISYFDPAKNKRTYINSTGDSVERNIPTEYDKYVVEEYYHYDED